MDPAADSKPSFSAYRKWGIGLQVVLLLALVFSVVVMVNSSATITSCACTSARARSTRFPRDGEPAEVVDQPGEGGHLL